MWLRYPLDVNHPTPDIPEPCAAIHPPGNSGEDSPPFVDLQNLSTVSSASPDALPKSPIVERALKFATLKLAGKTRGKHGEPTVFHSIRVAIVLYRVFHVRNCDAVVTALLHDLLEDSDTDYDEIAELFGEQVADSVVLLTKPKFYPKPTRKAIYESTLLCAAADGVLLVKLADLYENLQARRGLKRLRSTWKTARRLSEALAGRHLGPKLRRAVKTIKDLLAELETEEPVLAGIDQLDSRGDDPREDIRAAA
ncbi:HD domain-containing protein [Verrucomicrobiota bacterium sgz303538]